MQLVETPYLLEEKEKLVSKVIQFDQHHVMNIQLRTGEEIKEHDAKEYVLIVVRKGKVLFTVEGVEQLVTTGNILHMNPFEKHALKAVEDSDIIVIKIS
ncbi:AraC family ligand binding domain-containing protein [Bacillus sp. FJAT-22090]|uniref:AraC family ligand binding domain-containing protein n=1 Tax=Bacillus sp. FJAT-22090 TaxID=1581038 RepID=UPI0011A21F86|nr:AraC family ligand binding domain-containing protein [Bacillus sp. FJAT-22090]